MCFIGLLNLFCVDQNKKSTCRNAAMVNLNDLLFLFSCFYYIQLELHYDVFSSIGLSLYNSWPYLCRNIKHPERFLQTPGCLFMSFWCEWKTGKDEVWSVTFYCKFLRDKHTPPNFMWVFIPSSDTRGADCIFMQASFRLWAHAAAQYSPNNHQSEGYYVSGSLYFSGILRGESKCEQERERIINKRK